MNDTDALIAQAELGEEARKFLEGDLGKFLLGCAEQDSQIAREKLVTADASKADDIRGLQQDAKFGERFSQWLVGLVQDGEQSLQVLKQQQEQ